MNEMMEQCCGTDGMPNFDMMKKFMTQCGKGDFSDEDIALMKEFCGKGMPEMSRMKEMMESCGCHVPEAGKGDET